jgi:hypothetical protein
MIVYCVEYFDGDGYNTEAICGFTEFSVPQAELRNLAQKVREMEPAVKLTRRPNSR